MMPSAVSGVPRIVLRTEGTTLLLTAVILYARTDDSWWLFAILFLAPDISFLGYLGGPRIGAIAYNAGIRWLARCCSPPPACCCRFTSLYRSP